jgi:hypothetical protein
VPAGDRAFEAVVDEIVGGLAVAASQGAGKAAQTGYVRLRSARLDRALRHRRDETQPPGEQSDRPPAFGSTSSPLLFARFDHMLLTKMPL